MEPVTRVQSNQSTKSHLERGLIVSLDNNGPLVGPNLETVDTNNHNYGSDASSQTTTIETVQKEKKNWFWKRNKHSKKIEDPKKFSKTKKNVILLIIAAIGTISPTSTSIFIPALVTMQNYFQTNDTTMNASVAIFVFFTALFPLFWATFSDRFGRRKIYIASIFIAFVGAVCCAVSVTIEMFIVFRVISAMGSASVMAMGAGTIADIYEPQERGKAFAYFSLGPILGPTIGPVVGGYLNEALGWRSNFVLLAIYCFLGWISIVFFLPETWRPTPPKNAQSVTSSETQTGSIEPKKDNDNEKKHHLNDIESQKPKRKCTIVNPFGALGLLVFPNIALSITFTSCLFFVFYLNNTIFTRIYTIQYNFDSGIVGVCYLPGAIGAMVGAVVGGRLSDKLYNRSVEKAKANNQDLYPEMRIGLSFFFVTIILQLFSFIAFGWCVEKNTHYAYGLVCQGVLGFALMLPNVTLNAYMVDCFRTRGASVTACNNFVRYTMAGIGSLISSDIFYAMHPGPLFTFCGCILALAFVCLYILKKFHYKWAAQRIAFNSS